MLSHVIFTKALLIKYVVRVISSKYVLNFKE